ncbi:MAG: thioredoxin family protein [Leptospiraceae bacterium]|nr:thioredoxin family protein [Leptospiraceae bacterium]
MKFFIISIFFSISIFSEINWNPSYEKGLELAKSKGLPIIIDLYTDWCTYCKVLESKVFPNPEVETELKKFITIRINGDEYSELVSLYRVKGYPTVLFLDKNGAYLDRITGLPNTKIMTDKLKDVYEKRDLEDNLLISLKDTPESVLLNYRLGIYYYKISQFRKAEDYFAASVNSTKQENPEKKQESLFILGLIQIQEKRFSEAISMWSKYIKDFPTGDLSSAHYYRGISYYYLNKYKEAKEDFNLASKLTSDEETKTKIKDYINNMN